MEVERKIRKRGNSLGVNLPAELLKEAGIKEGDTVYISIENDDIVIRSVKQKDNQKIFREQVLEIIEEYMESKEGKPND